LVHALSLLNDPTLRRGKRQAAAGAADKPMVLDSERDYVIDVARSRRVDGKFFIGGRGEIFNSYTSNDYSTLAVVEHQFRKVM
jgi:hypothetical protein